MNYRRIKPPPGRRLDRTNPLSKNLILWVPYPLRAPFFLNYAKATASGTIAGSMSYPDTPLGPATDQDGGGGNYVDFGNHVDWQFDANSSWTIHAVTTIDGGDGSFRDVVRKDPGGAIRSLYLLRLTDTNVLQMQFGLTSATLDTRTGTTALTADANRLRWLTGVRDVAADTTSLYIDGTLEATGTDLSLGLFSATGGSLQTRYEAGATEYWNGKKVLDAIWNRALTAAELKTLFLYPFAPMQPERARPLVVDAASLTGAAFRRSLSDLGTRIGSRQAGE